MAEQRESIHGQWSSRTAFVMAAAGSAVGLGNVWKFPYITGENGGGAFVLVYLVCILLIGIPVLIAEILIGRRARKNPVNAFAVLAEEAKTSGAWSALGVVGVLSSFMILSFYVVIMSWSFAYIFYTGSGAFGGESAEIAGADFGGFQGRWAEMIGWTSLMVFFCMIVVMGGVKRGIERAVTAMMPGIILILLVLIGYSIFDGRFAEGFRFLFVPDFGELSPNGVIIALGHAFFTLSLASGTIIAYGAYVPRDVSIARTGIIIGAADTVIALMAGLSIFPLVFHYELEPSAGPGLIFVTLPIAFGEMPMGVFFGTLFFVMLFLAAFTSAISLLEPTVAMLMERFSLTRMKAVTGAGLVLWACSLPTVFSFNLWKNVHLIRSGAFAEMTVFDLIDYLTANILLPLGGLLTAIFAAWVISRAASREEFGDADAGLYTAWRFTLRYVAPVAIIIVFLSSIGLLDPILQAIGLAESPQN